MFLGYSWEEWRALLLLALATIATGVAVGLGAYLLQDRPAEVTCGEMDMEKTWIVSDQVAEDLDIPGESAVRVTLVVQEEIDRACRGRRRSSHRPVNSDLTGTVRQRLGER